MNLQHLKYAVEIERVGSITEAAYNLYISQPSLSKAIRDLEEAVGFSIFERTGRGMVPTDRGRALLDHAYVILRQISEIEVISSGKETGSQSLSVCIPHSEYIAEAVTRYCEELDSRSKLNVRFYEMSADRTVEAVTNGHVRLGIIRYPQSEDATRTDVLSRKSLKSELLWCFAPHVLTGGSGSLIRATPAELAGAVEIRYEDDCFRGSDDTIRSITLSSRAMMSGLLNRIDNAFTWDSPLPASILGRLSLRQLTAEPAPPPMCDMLIYDANSRFSPGERKFLDLLFKVKNEAAFDRK